MSPGMSTVIEGGTIVTGNARRDVLAKASLKIAGDRIDAILTNGPTQFSPHDEIVHADGYVIIPGFVQTHIHLCQTLFRGLADDLDLLNWLQQKIFPFESEHTEASMYISAMLGIAEVIRSGTTTILDMGSIRHEEEIIRAIAETGLRAFVGKAMMDINDACPKLRESTTEALSSTRLLAERWHNSYGGRIKYAVAPRFVLSCSDRLLKSICELTESAEGVLMHTHASESRGEIDAVRKRFGKDNIDVLRQFKLLSDKSCLAHCVQVNDREIGLLKEAGSSVAHCPSSNLKLGSGVANIPRLIHEGINVSIGADGAPCNNTLNMFQEMRLASLLQKPVHGAAAMPAARVFEMATMGGARALRMENEIGSIEVGKKADLALLNLDNVWNPLAGDIFSSIVYSSGPENVDSVMIDGKWVYRRKEFAGLDAESTVRLGKQELTRLLSRVGNH